jgi:hypothetical protein
LVCQSGASKFNAEYETASKQLYQTPGLDTTVNSPFHILYRILKHHFDNSNQGVSGVANIILKS